MKFWHSRRNSTKVELAMRQTLVTLNQSQVPLTITQLTKADPSHPNAAFVVNAAKALFHQGLVTTDRGEWNMLRASADADTFFITKAGRRQLGMGMQN